MPATVVNLQDLLSQENIALDLQVQTPEEVIGALVDLLARSGRVTDRAAVLADVLERERLMSTGIGSGVAIPHAQSSGAPAFAMALGRTTAEIDFKSFDGKPVDLIFLIVAPAGQGGFMRVLSSLSRLLYTTELLKNLRRTRTAEEAMRTIADEEGRMRA
jgi:fructose-specific phosphotransferase system IIA component